MEALFVFALWIANAVIHVLFALAVLASTRDRKTALVGPFTWFFATLLGGPLVALAYWLMNVSAFATSGREPPMAPPTGSAART